MDYKEMLTGVKGALTESEGRMVELVTKRDEEISSLGNVTKETKEKLEAATKDYEQVAADVKGLKETIANAEKEYGREGLFSGRGRANYKSLGQRVIEAKLHEEITEGRSRVSKEFTAGAYLGTKDAQGNYVVNYMTDEEFAGPTAGKDALETMNHITASRFDGEGRRVIPPAYGGVIPYIEKPTLLSAVINTQPISTDAIEYVQESAPFDNLRTIARGAANSGQKVINVANPNGFFVGQPIQVRTVAGEKKHTVAAVDYNEAAGVITLKNNLEANVLDKAPITSQYFSGQIEGGLKPWSGLRQFESYTESIKTLAHGMPVTRQMLDDLPRLRAEIDSKLLRGMETNREYQILYGNGDRRNLAGILTNPLRQTYNQAAGSRVIDGQTVVDSKVDAIRRALTLSQIAGVSPSSVVMNIFDWEEIEMSLDKDGRYLYTTIDAGAVQRLWRTPVVISEVMEPGRAILGDWTTGATLHVRQGANIRFSEQHEDFFMRNLVAILCEERVGLTISRPQSFVDIAFDA